MPVARYQLPDGRVARFEVPDGTTPEQAQDIGAQFFAEQSAQPVQDAAPAAEEDSGGLLQTVGNLLAGGVRGAGSIGATILAPYDMAKDAIAGKGLSLEANRQRRADMTEALGMMGADTGSTAFGAGKIATEVAGTMPIGGLLGKGAQAAGAAPKVVSALGSGGFSIGSPAATTFAGKVADAALRAGAGGIVGGTTAGIVDPDQAGTGAILGAAMPGAVQAAGAAGKAIKKGTSGLLSHILGSTTGAGADAIKVAYQSGKNGLDDFLKNMRGQAEFDDVVDAAKQGLSNMRAERQAAYRSGMVAIKNDKTILDFAPVDDAMKAVSDIGRFKGVSIKSKAADTVDELKTIVDQWKALDPADYHTPEGMDALKQAIGDIRDSAQFGTPARKAADQLYNAIKGTIVKQAPTYSKVMKEYADASNTLAEVEKALSLGSKTSKDTAIRKLQSLLRNNAQTSYGNRMALAKELEEKGGVQLMPAIAGQSMNALTPRGMVGALEKGAIPLTALATMNPAVLAAAPFTSPRLVGEAAYAIGRGTGLAQQAVTPLQQLMQLSGPRREALNAAARTTPLLILSGQPARQ